MCLDDQVLSTYLDGELTEPWKSQVEEHLSYCQACKARLKSFEKLSCKIKDAALTDEEIKKHQEKVLEVLEKSYLNKKRKPLAFLKKQLQFNVTQMIGVAAAFVIVFVGSWTVFGNHKGNVIDVPVADEVIDVSSITPVVSKETVKKGIENYSVEEIKDYLTSKGYEVEITLKQIQPVEAPTN